MQTGPEKESGMERLQAHHINKQTKNAQQRVRDLVRFACHGTNKVCGVTYKTQFSCQAKH